MTELSPVRDFAASDQGLLDEKGFKESNIEERNPPELPESDFLSSSGVAGTSGTSSALSFVNNGTPNTLTTFLPYMGLLGSSSSRSVSLVMYDNGLK